MVMGRRTAAAAQGSISWHAVVVGECEFGDSWFPSLVMGRTNEVGVKNDVSFASGELLKSLFFIFFFSLYISYFFNFLKLYSVFRIILNILSRVLMRSKIESL